MNEIQNEVERLSNQKEELLKNKNEIQGKLMEVGHLVNALVRRRAEIKGEIEKLKAVSPVDKSEKKVLEEKVAKLSEEIDVITAKIEIAEGKLIEEGELKRELQNFDYILGREAQRLEELKQSLEELKKIKPVDEKERKDFESKIEERESEVEKLNLQIVEIRKELDENSNDFSSAGKLLTGIKDDITKKQQLLNEYSSESTNIRIELARVETKKQDIKEEIIHDLGSEAELANVKGIPELDEELSRQEIEKLKSKMYAIGEIDPEVETEYGEVGERVSYLSSQMEDLEKAKADLEKLITDLDTKIKKQFEVSFASISNKFAHFFDLLFTGGEAKLELVHQKDEDGAEDKVGIEITAVPPGKKVRSLSALSGGERTLTSLALLFAILSVNPAPFILLDEVDAALDESNTKRFLKIVHELSKETQFIFISHNRETMKECDIIYGVTMDDTHASKLLSVRLEEADKIVAKSKK
jgi:chromosome segregation protein